MRAEYFSRSARNTGVPPRSISTDLSACLLATSRTWRSIAVKPPGIFLNSATTWAVRASRDTDRFVYTGLSASAERNASAASGPLPNSGFTTMPSSLPVMLLDFRAAMLFTLARTTPGSRSTSSVMARTRSVTPFS